MNAIALCMLRLKLIYFYKILANDRTFLSSPKIEHLKFFLDSLVPFLKYPTPRQNVKISGAEADPI